MMHGWEKSDPAEVAMKPAKSAAQAAGEVVERRVGAKGKAEQVARTGHRAGHACISNLLRLRHAYTLPSSPEVGARCLNWARRVLCGGRTATCVPTATGPEDRYWEDGRYMRRPSRRTLLAGVAAALVSPPILAQTVTRQKVTAALPRLE